MDIRSFVYGLVNLFPSVLRGPARRVADAVFAVWDDLSTVFRMVRPSWSRIWNGVNQFVWSVAQGFISAYKTAYWIAFDWLPRFVSTAVNTATAWAKAQIDHVLDLLQNGLSYVVNLARGWVDDALGLLSRLREWALEWINRIVDTLNAVVRIVSLLLTDPRVLAQWLVGAMVDALVSWLLSNLDRLAEALWARRAAIILRSIERFEAIIARLL